MGTQGSLESNGHTGLQNASARNHIKVIATPGELAAVSIDGRKCSTLFSCHLLHEHAMIHHECLSFWLENPPISHVKVHLPIGPLKQLGQGPSTFAFHNFCFVLPIHLHDRAACNRQLRVCSRLSDTKMVVTAAATRPVSVSSVGSHSLHTDQLLVVVPLGLVSSYSTCFSSGLVA